MILAEGQICIIREQCLQLEVAFKKKRESLANCHAKFRYVILILIEQ